VVLIELLIAFAILGIIISTTAVAMNPDMILSRARDSDRVHKLAQIMSSLESFRVQNKGKFPPGYVGDGKYGNNCVNTKYLYPEADPDSGEHCISNSLILGGYYKLLPPTQIQKSSAPSSCQSYFTYHVVGAQNNYAGIGEVDDNEHYLIQYCLESWNEEITNQYMNSYNTGEDTSNDYPVCVYLDYWGVAQCYIYDWQKIPPIQP
jgi:type II secretory pathway pseudopilin PulG